MKKKMLDRLLFLPAQEKCLMFYATIPLLLNMSTVNTFPATANEQNPQLLYYASTINKKWGRENPLV